MATKKKSEKAARPTQQVSELFTARRLLWIGGTVVGLGLIVLLALSIASEEFLTGVPEGTDEVVVGPPEHVEGEIYDSEEIPAGGDHSAIWQNCGFYDTEIQAENAVHSLEHGAVWISFSPTLPQDQVDILRGYTGGIEKVLVSPVAEQGSPIVATAWANQLSLDDATDTRLEQFVNEFRSSPRAPEPGGSCNGGVGTPSSQ